MYIKSLTRYGRSTWVDLTGFEQVVTDGIATYYAIDQLAHRIVKFNQNWDYQEYHKLPYPNTYTAKYIEGYFYFSSNNYFYKTNSSFAVISQYNLNHAIYRQFDYDSSRSALYVASYHYNRIDVFNLSCSVLESIGLGSYRQPFGLVLLNDIIYVALWSFNHLIVVEEGTITKDITVYPCTGSISSITVDSFGFLAVSCYNTQLITIYDSNGNYMKTKLPTSHKPYLTSKDANGRFIVMTEKSLDIYY